MAKAKLGARHVTFVELERDDDKWRVPPLPKPQLGDDGLGHAYIIHAAVGESMLTTVTLPAAHTKGALASVATSGSSGSGDGLVAVPHGWAAGAAFEPSISVSSVFRKS